MTFFSILARVFGVSSCCEGMLPAERESGTTGRTDERVGCSVGVERDRGAAGGCCDAWAGGDERGEADVRGELDVRGEAEVRGGDVEDSTFSGDGGCEVSSGTDPGGAADSAVVAVSSIGVSNGACTSVCCCSCSLPNADGCTGFALAFETRGGVGAEILRAL